MECGAAGASRGVAIFLHDGLGAIEAWKNVPELLSAAAGRRALIYDRWGYGQSDARARFEPGFLEAEVPGLREIVEDEANEPVDLVGHSDGASIALLFAAAHPELVRSVISIAAHTFVEPVNTKRIDAMLRAASAGSMPAWLERLHGDRAEQLLRAWAEVWLGGEHGRWDIRDRLTNIRCPVLALQGDGDEFGTRAQLDSIGEGVSTVETWLMEGAGHTPHADRPDDVVRRSLDFWKAIALRSSAT